MKRKAKQSASGGRLRLGLLMACAAAFLLVPASQAAAVHGEPHLKLTIIAEPGASGEVTSNQSETGSPWEGVPTLECNYPVGGPQEGICENEMEFQENPITGLPHEWRGSMRALPGPETFVKEWEVVTGEIWSLCQNEETEEVFQKCSVRTPNEPPNEPEDIEVNLYLGFEKPELTVNMIGVEGGGGEVVGTGGFPGEPPVACELPEGGAQEGVCKVESNEVEEGLWAVRLTDVLAEAPNSEFVEWEVLSGKKHPVAPCEPTSECFVFSTEASEDMEVNAVFACEEGKECPDEPTLIVNLIGVEGGGGEVFETGSLPPGQPAPISCILPEGGVQEGVCENKPPELEEGLWAQRLDEIPGPISNFVNWEVVSGSAHPIAPCEAGVAGEECLVFTTNPSEDIEVNAVFEAATFYPLTISEPGSGSGTVECEVDGEGGLGSCPSEVEEGSSVEVVATPDGSSTLAALTGGGAAAGTCSSTESGGTCTFTMTKEASVSAEFNLKTYSLTTVAIENGGTGSFECEVNGEGGLVSCDGTTGPYTHGDEIKVVASAGAESEVESISGPEGSECPVAGDRLSGTCEFTIEADSTVEAEFVSQGIKDKDPGNVKGSVDLQTTLETENCDDVDLGPFVPSASEETYSNDECVVTVTATGAENELRAADEEVITPNGTNLTGHLTQEPASGFTLNNALEVQGTGTTGGASPNPSGFLPLSAPAIIQDYGTPVSLDVVTVGFRQVIDAFEPLHTGTYSKTITLTLEQTVL